VRALLAPAREQVPLFQDCSAGLLLAMVSRLVPLIHMPGDMIIREGTEGRALYFINRGQCVVLRVLAASLADTRRPQRAATAVRDAISTGFVRSRTAMLMTLTGSRSRNATKGALLEGSNERNSASQAASKSARGLFRSRTATANARAFKQRSRPAVETLAVLSDNHFFGERALLSAGVTAASVQALTYCDLMALYASDFQAVVRDFPFFASVVDQVRATTRRTRARARSRGPRDAIRTAHRLTRCAASPLRRARQALQHAAKLRESAAIEGMGVDGDPSGAAPTAKFLDSLLPSAQEMTKRAKPKKAAAFADEVDGELEMGKQASITAIRPAQQRLTGSDRSKASSSTHDSLPSCGR
jgi:CRP-like cAMP-binding protein